MSPRRVLDPEAPVTRLARIRSAVSLIILTVVALSAVSIALLANLGHFHATRVLSNSMHPTFTVGDYVIVQDRPLAEIAQGQVVVLPEPDNSALYIHRLTSVDREGGDTLVTTKGDNNPAPDAWRLKVTSPTVPVFVTAVPTHALSLPNLPAASGQLLLAVGMGLVSATLLMPGRNETPRRALPVS